MWRTAIIALGLSLVACGRPANRSSAASTAPLGPPRRAEDGAWPAASGERGHAASGPARRSVEPPRTPHEFAAAKKHLRKLYDEGTWHTLYAGCAFSAWRIDWTSCCFPRDASSRTGLEWEHVVPAARFGGALAAWRDGHASCEKRGTKYRGRRCARKTSERFRRVEGDMHNLYPAIGALNQARGDRAMALIEGEERAFGACDFEVLDRQVEPRAEVRGEIARASLYLDAAYPDLAIFDDATRAMFEDWHGKDPPDDRERRRNAFIAEAQGNRNPWID